MNLNIKFARGFYIFITLGSMPPESSKEFIPSLFNLLQASKPVILENTCRNINH